MKKSYPFIIVSILIIFWSVSVIIGKEGLVGSFGKDIALFSIKYFGLFAYIFPILLFFPLYRLYKRPEIDARRIEKILASTLFIVSLLLFEAMVFVFPFDSYFGISIVRFLEPIIGLVGLWLFWFLLLCMSLFIYFDLEFETIAYALKHKQLPILQKSSALKNDTQTPKSEEEQLKEARKNSFTQEVKTEPSVHPREQEDIQIPKTELELESDMEDDIALRQYGVDEEDSAMYENMVRLIEPTEAEKEVEVRLIRAEKIEPKVESKVEPNIKDESPSFIQEPKEPEIQNNEPIIKIYEEPQITVIEEDEIKENIEENDKESYRIDTVDTKESFETTYKTEETKKESTLIVKELEENTKLLSSIEQGEREKPKDFKLPSLDFLNTPPSKSIEIDEREVDEKIEDLLDKLQKFKIDGDVVRTYSGPVVTTFEFRPAPSVKVSKILNLQDDLAMALKAKTIRIQAPVPGKDVVGIEIPNREFETIYLREILESDIFTKAASPLTIALGKDIVGNPFITDLKKLPHLLIAGTTGSGKSVGINAMILSLLYRNSPQNLKFLMIDPKMLEFSIYNDIPHLLTPVITQAKQAVVALNNMVSEMERRYALMSNSRTKNIESYNEKAKKEKFDELPYIVVIIDELADLMMTSGKDVEYSIGRLAQMARASGIHLVVATQRPSVDVVTGLIKANLPSRISFRVGQKIDSKVILDQFGAESLLGRGDMLFTPPGMIGLVRLHAPWCSESEIEKIVEFIKAQKEPEYNNDFLSEGGAKEANYTLEDGELDELFEEAKKVVLEEKKTSISYIQRRLQIGYNRSARIVEQLEAAGVLSAANAKGNREIL